MKVMNAAAVLTAVALAGCSGGALSSPDGGTGGGTAGGGAGTGGTAGAGGSTDGGIPPELRTQLETAVAAWAAFKGSCATYSYDRRWTSVFGAAGSTEVEVMNDVGTRRRYSTLSGSSVPDGGVWTTAWDEMGSDVGQHTTQYAAFPASTVEQLLAECETVLAHDPAAYTLTLQTDSTSGLPRVCTNFPRNCADDCESGIRIVTFLCAPLAN